MPREDIKEAAACGKWEEVSGKWYVVGGHVRRGRSFVVCREW